MTEDRDEIKRLKQQLEKEIIERKSAVSELEKHKQFARQMFMTIPVPVYKFTKDGDDLVLVDYNTAGLELSDGNAEKLIGTKASEFYKNKPSDIEPMRECIREKKTVEREIRVKGDMFHRDWDMITTYVFSEPDSLLAFTFDVTEKKQVDEELSRYRTQLEDLVNKRTLQLEMMNMELKKEMAERRDADDALSESEERYRFIAGLTSDFTFGGTVYPDRKMVIKWNKGSFEDITGFGINETIDGSILVEVAHPGDREKVLQHIDSYFTGTDSVKEFRVITRDKREKWVQVFGMPLRDDGRGGIEFISAAKDITDRKESEVELENRNRELRALNRIHEIFERSEETEAIMAKVIDVLLEEGNLDKGGVYFLSDKEGFLECRIIRGVDEDQSGPVRWMPVENELISELINSKDFFITEDEYRWESPDIIEFYKKNGISRIISMPVFSGNMFKASIVLCLSEDHTVSEDMLNFFKTIQIQLGIELERRDLLIDQQKYETDLKKLAGQLIKSIEEERSKIALNLHDEVGQSMIVIEGEFTMLEKRVDAGDQEMLERIKRIRDQIHDLTENVREISYSLHPAMLEDLGLLPTIQWYLDKFVRSSGIGITFETAGWDERIDQHLSLALYRIVQEALTNVVRHSRAKNVSLKLTKGYPDVIMNVVDDGKGFDVDTESSRMGLGIVGMRERVNSLNGHFILHSGPGAGTRIRVTLPLEGYKDETG